MFFRLWWPRHLCDGGRLLLLVGWIDCFNGKCTDAVVATATEVLDLRISPQEGAYALGLCEPENGCNDPVRRNADKQEAVRGSTWLSLRASYKEDSRHRRIFIPALVSLVIEGRRRAPYEIQVVLYEQPRLYQHCFSLVHWDFFPSFSGLKKVKEQCEVKKPYWIHELEKQERGPNIELVIKRLNCSASVESRLKVERDASPPRCVSWSLLVLASLYHAIVRISLVVPCCLATFSPLESVFQRSSAFKVLQSRLREIRSWRYILVWGAERPCHPDVAVAHRLVLLRSSIWFKIIVDLILGIIVGGLVLVYQASIMFTLLHTAHFTNTVLRTGCIWLMGVPAGFKLNNELAEVLGTAALTAIHAFSTLWGYMIPYSGTSFKAFGSVSILLGSRFSAALAADVFFLATAHLNILQQATAFIYGNQLKLLAALWRLFRGRKQNPLRNRVDSYEYTVEQLVVASLMFTPLLLLLPTTSVFYTFFTIAYTAMSIPRSMYVVLPKTQLPVWVRV